MTLQFQFTATDEHGRPQSGLVAAAGRARAADQLQARGWTVLSLDPAIDGAAAGRGPLSERDALGLLEELQTLTRAGLPLPAGLRAAAAELESAPLRAALLGLARHLDLGLGLDAALLAVANRFPAHLQALVAAGSRTGRLGDVLAEVVQGSNLGHELRRRLWTALAYPLAVLLVILGLTGFICRISSQTGERFAAIFKDFGINVPFSVTMIFGLTNFFATNDLWFLLGAIVVGLASWIVWGVLVSPVARRRFTESLPLVGPMARFVALAEFCHLAALLIESRMPLPEAVRLAGASVGDPALAADVERVAAAVALGEPLSTSLQAWPRLPAGLGQLLAWGEGQQDLAGSLRFAGDMFESRAEAQGTFARQVLGASLLLLIVWWIGFAIASIYLPITQSIQLLSKLSG